MGSARGVTPERFARPRRRIPRVDSMLDSIAHSMAHSRPAACAGSRRDRPSTRPPGAQRTLAGVGHTPPSCPLPSFDTLAPRRKPLRNSLGCRAAKNPCKPRVQPQEEQRLLHRSRNHLPQLPGRALGFHGPHHGTPNAFSRIPRPRAIATNLCSKRFCVDPAGAAGYPFNTRDGTEEEERAKL